MVLVRVLIPSSLTGLLFSNTKMKVAFGSYSQPKSFHERVAGSGYENIAHVLDKVWRNLDEERDTEYDVIFACLALPNTNERSKPDKWKKLIGVQEAGFGVVNTDWWSEYVSTVGFDGFLIHTDELVDFYKVFGKPVWKFNPAYCFGTARRYTQGVRKEEKRVCVNLVRHASTEGNVIGTLRVMQKLPDHSFHSYTGSTELLESLKSKFGITNWTIHRQIPWFDYLKEASKCYVHLSMDNRMTWGRFQLDALACGSVCVGCHSEVQKMVFGDTMISQTSTDEATTMIRRLSSGCDPVKLDESVFSHEQLRNTLLTVARDSLHKV
jgi:hypothetical protein